MAQDQKKAPFFINVGRAPPVHTRIRREPPATEAITRRLATPDMVERGPHQLTQESAMFHASTDAFMQRPSASTKDKRPYRSSTHPDYFPDSPDPLDRARLPPRSLFQNPWLNNFDIEAGEITRELKGAIRENNRHLTEDTSARIRERTRNATQRY